MTDRSLIERLRAALVAAGYTHDAVVELLGHQAHAGLGRNETTPAMRRTRDGSPLSTLVRLFLLQAAVPRAGADAALPGLVDALTAERLLEHSAGEVTALVDCRPYADDERDLWVLSDLTPGLDGRPLAVTADHVLGISPASTSLAQLTLRHEVDRSLDLGTGCGVQALHLAGHSREVVATDVNARALWLAGLNAVLNDAQGITLRAGSLFEPVAGDRFDLITTNPPFVISPPGGDVLTYRDSGMPGDSVVEQVVRQAPAHLTDGGWCQVLANWTILRDRPWDERLADWLGDETTALVVQREVLDPAAYVELWLKDAGLHGAPDYRARYDAWLGWFEEQQIEGVGFGWINLRTAPGPKTFLDHPYAVEQPITPTVAAWGQAAALLSARDDENLLRMHPVVAADVRQETVGRPGATDPEAIVLRQQRGLRLARRADTLLAGFVGAADGDLSTEQLLGALATLLDRDVEQVREEYLPQVRALVEQGYLRFHSPRAD
jgi:methylase of polypeptide subunit release factors